MRRLSGRLLVALLLLCWTLGAASAAAPRSVFLEDLSTAEVSAALKDGTTTIIIPVGGTEQSGPHLALGKHNQRVRVLAGRVAAQLGRTLVAPVLAYVPEGTIDPPSEHMRFAGTVSIPVPVFQAVLEAATRSFWQHGFRDVVLIGDHGGYQAALQSLAARLRPPAGFPAARVHFVGAYYQAAQAPFHAWLRGQGLTEAQIGSHAGATDTALQLAVAPDMVRPELLAQAAHAGAAGGTLGDPRAASAELGRSGADQVVERTVVAIRAAVSSKR